MVWQQSVTSQGVRDIKMKKWLFGGNWSGMINPIISIFCKVYYWIRGKSGCAERGKRTIREYRNFYPLINYWNYYLNQTFVISPITRSVSKFVTNNNPKLLISQSFSSWYFPQKHSIVFNKSFFVLNGEILWKIHTSYFFTLDKNMSFK